MDDRNAKIVISADTAQYTSGVTESYEATNKLNQALMATSQHLDGIVKRAGKKLVFFGSAELAALGSAVTVAATLDKQMSTLQASAVAMGTDTSKWTNQMRDGIRAISREIPVARGEIAQLATAIGKMGVTGAKDITTLTESFARFGAATGESPTALAQSQIGLSRTMGTMNNGPGTVQNFNDQAVTLSAKAGVPAQGILDFAQMLAPTARMAGVSQTDLMGISTAFNRAGADGGYAANAFNQIINDVMSMRQTGSPALRRYGTELGLTQKQLKTMAPDEMFSQLVQTVTGQGSRGVTTLNALGIDGLRAQRSLQALAAEGGLPKWIKEARSSYGNDMTETASKEAFSGLFDSLEKMKNAFTDIAQQIGQSVLPPINKLAEMAAGLASGFAKMMEPITKFIGPILGSTAGAALLGGGILKTWAAVSTPAMLRFMANTRGGLAVKEGWYHGRHGGGGPDVMDSRQLMFHRAMQDGTVGAPGRMLYGLSSGAASLLSSGTIGGKGLGEILKMGIGGGMGLLRTFINQTADFYDMSTMKSGYEKTGRHRARGFGRSFLDAMRTGVGSTLFGDPSNLDEQKGAKKWSFGNFLDETKSSAERAKSGSFLKMLTAETGRTTLALGKLSLAAVKAAGSMAGAGLGMAARGVGKGLWAGVKGVGNMLGSAIGPIGIGLAAVAGTQWVTKQANKDYGKAQEEYGITEGMSKYNEKLGIANKTLTTFSLELGKASTAVGNYRKIQDVGADRSTLQAEAQKDKEYVDRKALGVSTTFGAVKWLESFGPMSPEQMAEKVKDLYRRQEELGSSGNLDVGRATDYYLKDMKNPENKKAGHSAVIDRHSTLQDTAENVANKNQGLWSRNTAISSIDWLISGFEKSGKFFDWMLPGSGAEEGIRGYRQNLRSDRYGTDESVMQAASIQLDDWKSRQSEYLNKYGTDDTQREDINRAMRGDLYKQAIDLLKEGTDESLGAFKALYNAASQMEGTGADGRYDVFKRDWADMTDAEVQAAAVEDRIFGEMNFDEVQTAVVEGILAVADERLITKSTQDWMDNKDYNKYDNFKSFAQAVGDGKVFERAARLTENAGAQWNAIEKMGSLAVRGGGDYYGAMDLLQTAKGQYAPGSSQYNAAIANQQLLGQEHSLLTSLQNSPGQVLTALTDYKRALKMPDTDDSGEMKIEAQQNAKQAIVSLYQTLQQYDRQMQREEEDYYQQRRWTTEDFYRTQRQSTEAYHRQMLYSEQDFNIQRKRSNDEYERQMRRSKADHERGLRREEKSYTMQREWSVEDYNRNRVRSEADYNRQVMIQKREFNISLSRSEYDYNKSRARSDYDFGLSRFRATRDFNLSLARSEEDYARQMQYSQIDYQKSRKRSIEDFNLSISRSYEDYNKSRVREEEDHFLQLSRMSKDAAKNFYDPWLRVQSQATAGVDTFVENLRDQTERIQRQFENLKKLRSRGLSQDAIDMFGLSDPTKAQQLQRVTVEMTDKQIAEINRLTKEREKGAKQLTQSDFNEQFRRMEEDREKSLRRAEEDFKLSMERSIADFAKSMSRMAEDYNISIARSDEQFKLSRARSIEDFNRSLKDSLEDYKRSVERSDEDFALSRARSLEDFLRSLSDSEYQFNLSMARGNEDFQRSLTRQDKLRKISLNQAADDWERMLGRQARDYSRSMRNMGDDHIRAVNRSNKEFAISMEISVDNFIRQMNRGDIQRNKMLRRSRQDLIGFGEESIKNIGEIFPDLVKKISTYYGPAGNKLLTNLKSMYKKLFTIGKDGAEALKIGIGGAVNIAVDSLERVISKAHTKVQAIATAVQAMAAAAKAAAKAANSANNGYYYPPQSPSVKPPDYGGTRALGGIATGRMNATIGEGGPEMILPLNSRGMDYLTTALRQYAQTDAMRLKGTQSMFYQQPSQGNLTQFNFGDVSVASDTPDQFYREMKQKESLKKLVGH